MDTRPAEWRGRWRLLGLEAADAATLLDRGLALLERMTDDPAPTLRWYRATTPAVVLGRAQARRAADAGLVDTDGRSVRGGLVVATRGTGGGAVLMDSDLLSLDVVVPAGHPLAEGTPPDAFLPVGRAWETALRELGVTGLSTNESPGPPARPAGAAGRAPADVCYATLGRGEVAAGGRKLVGLAQRRRRAGTLIQCGLLRRWRPARLLTALGQEEAAARMAHSAVGLDELLDEPPDDAAVMAAVERQLATCSLPRSGR